MTTTLNIVAITAAMAEKGLNPAGLATKLGVSRESVSKWLHAKAVPRPSKLLQLSLTLGLSRVKLLGLPTPAAQPQVAFRMSRAKPAQDEHVARAIRMGKMLEALVPHLPFDKFETPPALKSPTDGYDYLQDLAKAIRKEMGVTETGPVNISTLAGVFKNLQAVIVPVLWGHRKNHENAIHIYLPRTATTWVYLNLDTRLCDLKFWLAHELGHTYTFSTLQGDAGEDFADGFAGALLFPEVLSLPLYKEASAMRSIHARVQQVNAAAAGQGISPVCVAKQLDRYADRHGLPRVIDDNKALYQALELSKPPLASKELLGSDELELKDLIRVGEAIFHTPLYSALKTYLRDTKASAGYVQGILDCSLVDAKQFVSELA